MSYAKELEIACLAVQRAARLTKTILASVDKGALDKQDNTPVTIADFAAQALIISAVHGVFPSDQFVGEESSAALRENPQLLDRVWEVVSTTKLDDDEEQENIALATPSSPDEMLDLIDLGGKGVGGSEGRIWVLDPVDGTATFIKGQQYAVCLALLEDGQQKVGVLGCPNLKLEAESDIQARVQENVVDSAGAGHMLSAVVGQGAYIRPLANTAHLQPARRLPTRKPAEASSVRFADCEYADSTDYTKHGQVATALGAPWPATADLWSSQMRYVAVAVGECNTLIKIVRDPSHRSSIWDHAGGMLIAQEVGCTITDAQGKAVSCGQGRKLASYGLVVAPAPVHARVLEAVQGVIQSTQ